jgi:hypothetical protein
MPVTTRAKSRALRTGAAAQTPAPATPKPQHRHGELPSGPLSPRRGGSGAPGAFAARRGPSPASAARSAAHAEADAPAQVDEAARQLARALDEEADFLLMAATRERLDAVIKAVLHPVVGRLIEPEWYFYDVDGRGPSRCQLDCALTRIFSTAADSSRRLWHGGSEPATHHQFAHFLDACAHAANPNLAHWVREHYHAFLCPATQLQPQSETARLVMWHAALATAEELTAGVSAQAFTAAFIAVQDQLKARVGGDEQAMHGAFDDPSIAPGLRLVSLLLTQENQDEMRAGLIDGETAARACPILTLDNVGRLDPPARHLAGAVCKAWCRQYAAGQAERWDQMQPVIAYGWSQDAVMMQAMYPSLLLLAPNAETRKTFIDQARVLLDGLDGPPTLPRIDLDLRVWEWIVTQSIEDLHQARIDSLATGSEPADDEKAISLRDGRYQSLAKLQPLLDDLMATRDAGFIAGAMHHLFLRAAPAARLLIAQCAVENFYLLDDEEFQIGSVADADVEMGDDPAKPPPPQWRLVQLADILAHALLNENAGTVSDWLRQDSEVLTQFVEATLKAAVDHVLADEHAPPTHMAVAKRCAMTFARLQEAVMRHGASQGTANARAIYGYVLGMRP